jgi:hypothetical protein
MTKRNSMKNLFTLTALTETATGIILVIFPSAIATILLGSTLGTPVALTVARVAGVALIALGIASWFARNTTESSAVGGFVIALAFYNLGVFVVLVYAGTGLHLSGIGLWPVVLVHLAMAVWCIFILSWSKSTIHA